MLNYRSKRDLIQIVSPGWTSSYIPEEQYGDEYFKDEEREEVVEGSICRKPHWFG